MVRLINTLFFLSIGSWYFAAVQELAAQQSVDLSGDAIRIGDFGLENEIWSAIDLIGPEDSSAGQHRAALVHRLQCWIDGSESCSVADPNDPRVRALRRFLGLGPAERHGAVVVHFPDQTRIQVHLTRVSNSGPVEWTQSAYALEVRPDTVQAPGMPAVPSGPAHLQALAYEGMPAIRSALERLKQRFETSEQR